VQASLVDVGVPLIIGSPVERARAIAIKLDLVVPNILVERLEVVIVDQAIL
jgi:hypothetical protein